MAKALRNEWWITSVAFYYRVLVIQPKMRHRIDLRTDYYLDVLSSSDRGVRFQIALPRSSHLTPARMRRGE